MKNLKTLTPDEWELYTTEIAEKLLRDYPTTKRGVLNGEYAHPRVENFCGMVWEGPERDQWHKDIDKKYRKLKKNAN